MISRLDEKEAKTADSCPGENADILTARLPNLNPI